MRNKHKGIGNSITMDSMNDYPPIKIPKNMKETQYPGYYITEDGKSYRKPGKYDKFERYGKINEYGLIYLKPGFRGHPGLPEHQYECINISIRDENGKFLKQIKKSIHQLVAEVFVPNPEGHNEIRYGNSRNPTRYIKKDGEWILIPNNRPPWNKGLKGSSWNTLPDGTVTTRKVNGSPAKFIKQNGEWVYQKKKKFRTI